MCGRVGFYADEDWKDALRESRILFRDEVGRLRTSCNIAPTQPMATLLNNGNYTYTRFGLIPHWAKDAKFQPVNARAESVALQPLLVPYSGAMTATEVSTYVNAPAHIDTKCIRAFSNPLL